MAQFTTIAANDKGAAPGRAGRILLALAAPCLTLVLAWGMVDAFAITQASLMHAAVHAASSSVASVA